MVMFLEKKKWVGQTGHTYPESCVLIYPFWTFYKQTLVMYICVQDREVVEHWGFSLECCPLSGYRKNLTLGTYPTVLPFYDGERGKREFLIDRKPKEKYTILTVYADLKNIVSYYLCCFIDFHFGWVGLCCLDQDELQLSILEALAFIEVRKKLSSSLLDCKKKFSSCLNVLFSL